MKKDLYTLLWMMLVTYGSSYSQLWQSLPPTLSITENEEWQILPAKYHLSSLDHLELLENQRTIDLPMPNGTLHTFEIMVLSNFAAGLAQKYPQIQNYLLQSLEHPSISGRMDLYDETIRVVMQDSVGEIYIDPVKVDGKSVYIVYYTKDYEPAADFLSKYIGHEHVFDETVKSMAHDKPKRSPFKRSVTEPVNLYVYDLALTCTGEYAQKHGGTTEGALAAMNTALNRINFVLETELAVRLQLISNNDTLIHLNGSTDPFTNGNAGQMALESNNYLLSTLGSAAYDVGHVFGTQCSNIVGTSGGVGTVCGGNKGYGSSCEISTTDRFYIGIVCHELGHQFGAEHTWNNCPSASSTQFNSGTAFEPGSGSTIMSYGGACGDQNIVNTVDFYFHSSSLDEIITFSRLRAGQQCAEVLNTGNHHPSVEVKVSPGLTLPMGTPFRLTATGEDMDGDALVYTWEQYDAGIGLAGMSPIGSPQGDAPIFRSRPPTSTPVRYIPSLAKLAANISDLTEVLPTYERSLNFRVTARDQVAEGGGVAWADLAMEVSGSAGPFTVSSFNEMDTVSRGDYLEIFWDVANTDQDPVNCRLVDIILSYDGGLSFSDTLSQGAVNDGSAFVLVPDQLTDNARLMVAAADHIFFDMNDEALLITEAAQPGFAADVSPAHQMLCLPAQAKVSIETFALLDFSDSLEVEAIEVPEGIVVPSVTRFAVGDPLTWTIDFSQAQETRTYTITFAIRTNDITVTREVSFAAVSNNFSELALEQPNGESGLSVRPTLSWIPTPQASNYQLQISPSPSFDTDLIQVDDIVGSFYSVEVILDENQLYYWRVKPQNICGTGEFTPTGAFHTVNLTCNDLVANDIPINISQNNVVRRTSVLPVSELGTISDLNITNVEGFHESFGDLIFQLVSPAGTTVTLLKQECGFSNRQFKFGFDDEALDVFNCQTNFVNQIFRPRSALAAFHGEPMQGDWMLVVHDSVAGSGGRVEAWSLQLCGTTNPISPDLSVDTLFAGFATNTPIDTKVIFAEDDQTGPEELNYTLVTAPASGFLMQANEAIEVGDQFSQASISNGLISYTHTASDSLPDLASFTLVDGTGGWQGPFDLPILVSQQSVNINDLFVEEAISIAPNPSPGHIHFSSTDVQTEPIQITLYDLHGRRLIQSIWSGGLRHHLDISHLPPGIYQVTLLRGLRSGVQKIVVADVQ